MPSRRARFDPPDRLGSRTRWAQPRSAAGLGSSTTQPAPSKPLHMGPFWGWRAGGGVPPTHICTLTAPRVAPRDAPVRPQQPPGRDDDRYPYGWALHPLSSHAHGLTARRSRSVLEITRIAGLLAGAGRVHQISHREAHTNIHQQTSTKSPSLRARARAYARSAASARPPHPNCPPAYAYMRIGGSREPASRRHPTHTHARTRESHLSPCYACEHVRVRGTHFPQVPRPQAAVGAYA